MNNARLKHTAFASTTVNVGKGCTRFHKDWLNKRAFFCGIVPSGTFDFTKGGHIIFWELGVVVDFPAGCVALLPSSLVTHGNTAIGKDEFRTSFVWFTGGTLFQYDETGMKTLRELRKDPEKATEFENLLHSRVRNLKELDVFMRLSDFLAAK